MSISAIGNTYSYIYNFETKKLTTTEGTQNDFTKYFNGEIEGHESEILNGFDKQRRSGFKDVLSLLEEGAFGKEKPAEDAVIELSGKNIDGDTIEFSVNGKTYLRCSVSPSLTYEEYEKFHKAWMSQGADTLFSYTENKGYNKAENSISLVQGMAARLSNGFVLSITDSMVYPEGDFKDNTAAKESAAVASALSHLIKVANGQIPMNMFYSRNQDNSAYAKIGLEAFGVDTSRPFTINERTFHFDEEGQIRVGSGE